MIELRMGITIFVKMNIFFKQWFGITSLTSTHAHNYALSGLF